MEVYREGNSIVVPSGAARLVLTSETPDFYFDGQLNALTDTIEDAFRRTPSPYAERETTNPLPGGIRIFQWTEPDWFYDVRHAAGPERHGGTLVLDMEYVKNHEAYPYVRAGNLAHFVVRGLFPEIKYPFYSGPLSANT